MEKFQGDILAGVREEITKINSCVVPANNNTHDSEVLNEEGGDVRTFVNGRYRALCYAKDGSITRKFWMVPKSFKFPKADRRSAWNFWLLGQPEHKESKADGTLISHPICPFRHFQPTLLPRKARDMFKINWRPVLRIMDKAIVSGESYPTTMTSNEIEMWWDAGTELLKSRAKYIFIKHTSKCHLWGIGTWSKHVLPSYIKKNGTEEDNLALPLDTKHWSDAMSEGVTKVICLKVL